MKSLNALSAIVALSNLMGCAASSADVASSDPIAAPSNEPTFTETAVTLNADGTRTIASRTITIREEQRQVVLRDAPTTSAPVGAREAESTIGTSSAALTKDIGCAGASFWLYDQNNRAGNKICFSGSGAVHLADFKDCSPRQDPATCPTWAQNVGNHSYWAGSASGHFQERYSTCVAPTQYHCPDFKPFQTAGFLSWCEAFKPDLDIGDKFCLPPNVWTDWSSPMSASGNTFTPGGAVSVQILSSTSSVLYTLSATADSSGNVSLGLGNGYKGGISCQGNNCGSCGETIKMIDAASGASATAPSPVCYEPNKS